jgi:hypothetical protein
MHEPSSPSRTLGWWVRIPLDAWMPVYVYSVFMFCVQVAALRRADPPSKESYRLCIGLRNLKSGQGPKGYTAIEREREREREREVTSVFYQILCNLWISIILPFDIIGLQPEMLTESLNRPQINKWPFRRGVLTSHNENSPCEITEHMSIYVVRNDKN